MTRIVVSKKRLLDLRKEAELDNEFTPYFSFRKLFTDFYSEQVEKTPVNDQNLFINLLKRRVLNYNQNANIFISGLPGTGKTYSALRLCEVLDPDFDIHKQCVFTIQDFLDFVSAEKKEISGKVLLYDDCGFTYNRQDWYDSLQKALGKVLQTYRFKNLITIFTAPSPDYVNSAIIPLLHYVVLTRSIDRTKNQVIASLRETNLTWNYRYTRGKQLANIFLRRPIVTIQTVGTFKIDLIRINKPSRHLINEYERLREDWINTEYAKIINKPLDVKSDSISEIQAKLDKDFTSLKKIVLDLVDARGKIIKKRVAAFVNLSSTSEYVQALCDKLQMYYYELTGKLNKI